MNLPEANSVIGTQGVAWTDEEVAEWRMRQLAKRSYATDVISRVDRCRETFNVVEYGCIEQPADRYPLVAIRSRDWNDVLPVVLVTGGVHGYETSGVHGALKFIETQAQRYAGRVNLLVVPCVSPWAYERIQRWNADAVDPNRSFRDGGLAEEAASVIRLIAPLRDRVLVHVDLHETTDTDESEFRPALAARDGKSFVPGAIPDGFYLVGDSDNPQLEFQRSIITAVSAVTHIAPADDNGQLIGDPVVSPGVIVYPVKSIGLCAGVTDAPFTTTTEVYPDSPRATPEQCNAAQVAAVCAAIDFALAQRDADVARVPAASAKA